MELDLYTRPVRCPASLSAVQSVGAAAGMWHHQEDWHLCEPSASTPSALRQLTRAGVGVGCARGQHRCQLSGLQTEAQRQTRAVLVSPGVCTLGAMGGLLG